MLSSIGGGPGKRTWETPPVCESSVQSNTQSSPPPALENLDDQGFSIRTNPAQNARESAPFPPIRFPVFWSVIPPTRATYPATPSPFMVFDRLAPFLQRHSTLLTLPFTFLILSRAYKSRSSKSNYRFV